MSRIDRNNQINFNKTSSAEKKSGFEFVPTEKTKERPVNSTPLDILYKKFSVKYQKSLDKLSQ